MAGLPELAGRFSASQCRLRVVSLNYSVIVTPGSFRRLSLSPAHTHGPVASDRLFVRTDYRCRRFGSVPERERSPRHSPIDSNSLEAVSRRDVDSSVADRLPRRLFSPSDSSACSVRTASILHVHVVVDRFRNVCTGEYLNREVTLPILEDSTPHVKASAPSTTPSSRPTEPPGYSSGRSWNRRATSTNRPVSAR